MDRGTLVFSAFGIRDEEISEIHEFASEIEWDKLVSDAVVRKTTKDRDVSEH